MIDGSFTGRCGADADLKFSASGLPYASFAVAVDVGKGADGQPATEWIRCSFYGGAVVDLAPKLCRGDEVEVAGKLTVGRWTAADGTAKAGLNCLASYVNPKAKQRKEPTRSRDMIYRGGARPAGFGEPAAAGGAGGDEGDGDSTGLPW